MSLCTFLFYYRLVPFTCYYCSLEGEFDTTVIHCKDIHSNKILNVRRKEINEQNGKIGLRTLNFNIIPDIIKATNKQSLPSDQHWTPAIEIIDMENEDFGLCDLSLEELPGSQCNSPFFKTNDDFNPA